MVLEHCSLVPLIINYRIGRDLMKIFTFKWPRILCLWENAYFSLLTDAAQTTAKQLLIAHRYTPILHTLPVHGNTYPVFSQLFSFHFIITKKNWWTAQERQHFSVKLSGMSRWQREMAMTSKWVEIMIDSCRIIFPCARTPKCTTFNIPVLLKFHFSSWR